MSKTKVYLLIQTVLCILLVIVLSYTVIDMYREGVERAKTDVMAWYFTRELVAERFRPIAPLFFAAIGFGLAGIVLVVRDENQDTPLQDAELKCNLLAERVAEPSEAMKAEQAKQKRLLLAGWIGFAICMIPILIYVSNGEHFPQGDVQLEQMIKGLASVFLPFSILGIACLAISSMLQEKSILREIEATQTRMQEEKAAGIKSEKKASADPTPKKAGTVRLVLLVLAVIFLVAGVFNGSARDVLMKAVKICTECVGLG